MTDLLIKSTATLELPAVLSLLAGEAVSEEAKARSLALRPSVEEAEVRFLQSQTSAARAMMDKKGEPSFREVRPVATALARAEMGGMLNTKELLDIAGVLRAARAAVSYGSGDREEKTPLDALFSSLRANKFLEEKITNAIVGEDEIADAASSDLASIRRHIRATGAKVRDILNKIISSPTYAKYLQENIITMRSDRYVVPVRAEHKGDVPGLVHDVSSSGATVFVEPMGVVQANNELRELAAKEKREIERILMELSADAAGFRDDILDDYGLLVALDCVFARAKLSYRMYAMPPEIVSAGGLVLRRARHPLLERGKAVPINVRLGGEFDTLVITGPNTGGKTVTLKTIGLLSLMAQCGLHLPTDDGSRMPVFTRVLADVGDEQSIEQSLSTFSSHMTNIVRILGEADERSLVLFDELGAGTDPVEGAALAVSIIQEVRACGALVAATTHYAELKVFAMTTKGVVNASCEFDVETLRPTYKLLIGVPGKSNAFAISARLGLPEEIIARARAQLGAESLRFEDVLTQLERQRQSMEKEKEEARALRLRQEQDAKTARAYREKLEGEREKAAERARAEARRILDEARAAADETFSELDEMRRRAAKSDDWQSVNEARAGLRRRLNEAEDALGAGEREDETPPPDTRPAAAGDTVEILSTRTRASVIQVNKDGTLRLQAGILKITARPDEVRLAAPGGGKQEAARIVRNSERQLRTLGASSEIDLRGMMTDEAVPVLERFLDAAMLAKLEKVTVIHGKGTGALRAAVQQSLRKNRAVKSFRLGRYGEGEDGVTIVELK
ncbi:MAG TPA: endonuclease MutS2 [Oscillospiraceae bacterium]|nr:endonuclease MutS2 [Oscillospiraceae bacterium]